MQNLTENTDAVPVTTRSLLPGKQEQLNNGPTIPKDDHVGQEDERKHDKKDYANMENQSDDVKAKGDDVNAKSDDVNAKSDDANAKIDDADTKSDDATTKGDDVNTKSDDAKAEDDDAGMVIPVYLFDGPSTPELPNPDSLSFGDGTAAAGSAARPPKPPRKFSKTKGPRRRTLRMSQKHKEAVKRRAKQASKKLVTFLVSHVGLSCMVVAYSIMGGFIFEYLESETEGENQARIKEIRDEHVEQLWNVTNTLNVLHPEEWQKYAEDQLRLFQKEVYDAVKDYGWDGSDNVTSAVKWTYASALLYSVTVITTIGYGNLAPRTMEGRLMTMLYAIIGIPMTLMCLANLGSLLAHCFRLLWAQVVCKPCRNAIKRRATLNAAKKKAAAAAMFAQIGQQRRAQGGGLAGISIKYKEATDSPASIHDGTALLKKSGSPNVRRGSRGSLSDAEAGQCSPVMVSLAGEMSASHRSFSNLGSAKTPKSECSPASVNTQVFRYSLFSESVHDDVNTKTPESRSKPDEGDSAVKEPTPFGKVKPETELTDRDKLEPKGLPEDEALLHSEGQTNESGEAVHRSKSSSKISLVVFTQTSDIVMKAGETSLSPDSQTVVQYPDDHLKTGRKTETEYPEIMITEDGEVRNAESVDTIMTRSLSTHSSKQDDSMKRKKAAALLLKSSLAGKTMVSSDTAQLLPHSEDLPTEQLPPQSPDLTQMLVSEVSTDEKRKKKKKVKQVVRVPIMVCLVMVSAYIILGAVCFSYWEKWSFLESSYFCFITLSTIGFGDLVPGYEQNDWDNTAKRVTCTLYLLFGLALLAMCFELIQTEIKQKFLTIAKSFGFYVEEEEEEQPACG